MRQILNNLSQKLGTVTLKPNNADDIYDLVPIERYEIRLLTIHAGHEDIKCTLHAVPLTKDNIPTYETISYTWGDSREREPILVNDWHLNAPVNTVNALRCARLASTDRTVWIDFISINQNDIDERSDQVARMANIYQWSRCNLIHLGDDGELAAQAFASIETIAKEAEAEMSRKNVSLGDMTFPSGYFSFSDIPMQHQLDMNALAWLYERPWFGRLWVLQEAVLSPRSVALCGDKSIDFSRIEIATAYLEYKTFVIDQSKVRLLTLPGFRAANNMWLLRKDLAQHTFANPFAALIGFSPFGEATDMRDQVYGLVGLYQSCGGLEQLPSALQPDYRKSISKVLRDATRYAIEEEQCLAILERLPLRRDDRPAGLPSWVSEWFRYHQSEDARALTNTCYACGLSKKWGTTEVRPTNDANILKIDGISVDAVQYVSDAIKYRILSDPQELHGMLTAWQSMATSASEEAFGTTVLGGKWWTDADATKENALQWPSFLRYLLERNAVPSSPALLAQDASAEDLNVAGFFRQIWNACYGRCLFTTRSGRIGIGPIGIKSSDTLTILQGGHLPFILRQEQKHYEILGPAYVYGIMYGEAVEENARLGANIDVFDIK